MWRKKNQIRHGLLTYAVMPNLIKRKIQIYGLKEDRTNISEG